MNALLHRLEYPFYSPRNHRKLTKYAILLNEPSVEDAEDKARKPGDLASQLLPDVAKSKNSEDLVAIMGEALQNKIKAHAGEELVTIFKPDDILSNNTPNLVPVMYRIAVEHFAQQNNSTFKIFECRNSTKLKTDWKPSLPDKLISLGHQVVVVQLETSFVPYNDFAYAILRQLQHEWKIRLPRSFFYPDDVCKVEATPERDLCVVSPSMPDGDLEINKKMGQLNYELLMMIKASCMNAMKNYLLKRDLRVGKFSDTLDGVSALRQLYRRLQQRLNTGEAVELGSNSLEDLRSLVKQSVGGADVLAAQTWIEYGRKIGLDIPASASSSATSISSARKIIQGNMNNSDSDSEDEATTLASTDAFGGEETDFPHQEPAFPGKEKVYESVFKNATKGIGVNDVYILGRRASETEKRDETINPFEDDDGLDVKNFTEFKESLAKLNSRKDGGDSEDSDEDFDAFNTHQFSAESILQILQLPNKAL